MLSKIWLTETMTRPAETMIFRAAPMKTMWAKLASFT
jgi:hypothetical protein